MYTIIYQKWKYSVQRSDWLSGHWISTMAQCLFPLDYISDLPGTPPRETFRPRFIRKEVTIRCVYTNPVNLRSAAFSWPIVAFSRMSFSQFLFMSFGKVYQIKSALFIFLVGLRCLFSAMYGRKFFSQ